MTSMRAAHRLDDPDRQRTEDVISDINHNRTFQDLHLKPSVFSGLKAAGYVRPSPIQWSAIPVAKIGLDLIVQSKSGTGKTLVYAVTALNMANTEAPGVQALILCPTREIAVQGARTMLDVAGASMPDLKVCTLIGGMSVKDDEQKLRRCHVVVGTPGRVKQMIQEGFFKAASVRLFCLDEADKMMESSFKADVTFIFNRLPESKQVVALSATYPDSLAAVLGEFMRNGQHVRLNAKCQVLVGLDHYALEIPHHPKPKFQLDVKFNSLLQLLNSVTFSQALVFTNYSLSAETICEKLTLEGWPSIFIAAALQDQHERLRAINSLKQFATRILVTTDLSARGVDAANVNLVVNFDVPWDSRTFLHRCGRAGRFGSRGISVTLASEGGELVSLRKSIFRTGTVVKVLPRLSSDKDELLPDLWKVDSLTEAEKSGVENYPVLEGIECTLEESENGDPRQEMPAAESVAVSEKKKRHRKKRKNGIEADHQEPAEEPSPCLDKNEHEEYLVDYDADGYYDSVEDCYEDENYNGNFENQYYEHEVKWEPVEDDSEAPPQLHEDFLVDSYSRITGNRLQTTNQPPWLGVDKAKSILSTYVKTASERYPYASPFGADATFEDFKKFASEFRRDEVRISVETRRFPDERNLNKELVLEAIDAVAADIDVRWENRVKEAKRRFEISGMSMKEVVERLLEHGDLPSVPTTEAKLVSTSHSSGQIDSPTPRSAAEEKPVVPDGCQVEALRTRRNFKKTDTASKADGGLPQWVAVDEEAIPSEVEELLFHQNRHDVEDHQLHCSAALFPDPDDGLDRYLEPRGSNVIRRPFDDWWTKIQANKRLIAEHEFNSQIALAKMRYGRNFSSSK